MERHICQEKKTPNISIPSSEAHVMFTKQWLKSKDPDEQQRLVAFAWKDIFAKKKPNISVPSSEAHVMFTKQWLESKDPDQQQCLVAFAWKDMNKSS